MAKGAYSEVGDHTILTFLMLPGTRKRHTLLVVEAQEKMEVVANSEELKLM